MGQLLGSFAASARSNRLFKAKTYSIDWISMLMIADVIDFRIHCRPKEM